MLNLNIIVDDELRDKATKKCNEIIDLLGELSIPEKVFVLHQLVESFNDISGINVCKFFEISQEEAEK